MIFLLKQKEVFDELVNERKFEIDKLRDQINFNNLTYHYKGKKIQNILSVSKVH